MSVNFCSNALLKRLIAQTKEIMSKLPPEEKAAMDRETAISFAYGNLTCTGRRPYITRELVADLYDRATANGKDINEED